MPNETVIFLHIPKTAGSTLLHILQRAYKPENRLFIEDDSIHEPERVLSSMSNAQKREIALLAGHVEFGIHTWLPQPATYFTILRHPIERIISDYYFLHQTPHHPLHDQVVNGQISLQEYVDIPLVMDNSQTRMLAGAWRQSGGPCTVKTLQKANENIQTHFSLIGLTEHFDESLVLLQRRFGWKSILYHSPLNKTANRPHLKDLPKKTVEAIIRANEYDLDLYTFAQTLFSKQINTPSFAFAYKKFQIKQRLAYTPFDVRRYSVRTFMREHLPQN